MHIKMETDMHIYVLIILSLLTLPLAAHAQEKMTTPPSMQKEAATFSEIDPAVTIAEDYYCPMHTDQHGKKGDICPICKMHLIPVPHDLPDASTSTPEKPAEVSP